MKKINWIKLKRRLKDPVAWFTVLFFIATMTFIGLNILGLVE